MSDHLRKCAETFYLVEATFNEMHSLWLQFSTEGREFATFTHERRIDWKQDTMGYCPTIGTIKIKRGLVRIETMPVRVDVFWNIIGGRRVGFYEAMSQVVDYRMVEKWRKKAFPNSTGHTNATNFHHCLRAIEEANEREKR